MPVADLDRAANGSVLAAPLVYIPPNEVANSTTERGLRFHMLRSNSTAYINELVRLYYYTAQIALGSKACSAGCAYCSAATLLCSLCLVWYLLVGESISAAHTCAMRRS